MRWILMTGLFLAGSTLGADDRAQQKQADAKPAPFTQVTLSGKVVTFAEAMASRGIAFDQEPQAKQAVLLAPDGTITPLLSDEASRALFLDPRVRNRKAELTARRYPGLPYLQVVSFRIEQDGRLQTPEYYCEVCAISVRYPQDCPCCQGQLIFQMKPEAR